MGEQEDATTGRRGSFAGTVALTFGTYVGAASLSLLNLFVVARVLGATGRGDIVFLITVAIITGHLGALSVQEANANFAASRPETRGRLATNSLVLAGVCGAVAAGIVAALVALFPAVGGEVDDVLLWVALAFVPVVVLKLYLNFLLQADYAFAVTNVAWLIGPAATFAANGLLALADSLTVASALAAWIGGQALGAGILVAAVARSTGYGRPDPRLARETLAFGAKAHAGRSLAVGNYRIDQWFVGSIAGSRELGLYSAATAWAEVLTYLPGVVVLVQRPALVRAARDAAAAFGAQVFRVTVLLTVPLCVALILAAPVLCETILGPEFAGAIDDLRILALAGFGLVARDLLGSALTAQGRPLLTTGAVGSALVVTIVLDLLLVPRWGGLGAAVAAAVASTVGGIVVAFIYTWALGGRRSALVPRLGDVPWLWRELRGRVSGAAGSRASGA